MTETNGGEASEPVPGVERADGVLATVQQEEADSKNDPISEISAATKRLETRLDGLCQTVEERLRYDKAKEEAFEKLYGELEELKRNSLFEQLRPLFVDFILLFDRIENVRNELSSGSPLPVEVECIMKTVSDELVEILYRREIELIRSPSDVFDPTIQQAIGTESASDASENNRVARVVRRGFRYRNRVLRPEEVIVKKQNATTNQQK
jgi:molecular chaperone GrpE